MYGNVVHQKIILMEQSQVHVENKINLTPELFHINTPFLLLLSTKSTQVFYLFFKNQNMYKAIKVLALYN